MKNILYILVILYNFNIFFNTFINVMIKNVTLFNSKNNSQFSIIKGFFDTLFNCYQYKTNFNQLSYCVGGNSLTVKLQSSKLSL